MSVVFRVRYINEIEAIKAKQQDIYVSVLSKNVSLFHCRAFRYDYLLL